MSADSKFLKQWAADKTQFADKIDPPQIAWPVLVYAKMATW